MYNRGGEEESPRRGAGQFQLGKRRRPIAGGRARIRLCVARYAQRPPRKEAQTTKGERKEGEDARAGARGKRRFAQLVALTRELGVSRELYHAETAKKSRAGSVPTLGGTITDTDFPPGSVEHWFTRP